MPSQNPTPHHPTSHHPTPGPLAPDAPGDRLPRVSVANPKRVRLGAAARFATAGRPAIHLRRWSRLIPRLPRIPTAPRFA